MKTKSDQWFLQYVLAIVRANPRVLDSQLIEQVQAQCFALGVNYPGDMPVCMSAGMARAMGLGSTQEAAKPVDAPVMPETTKKALPARALAFSCYRGQEMHEWHRR